MSDPVFYLAPFFKKLSILTSSWQQLGQDPLGLCYALVGALCVTCTRQYCQVNCDLVDKVLGVQSIDIAQYSKAPR